MVTQRRTFCMRSFVYSPVYLPVIYIFTAYHPLLYSSFDLVPSPHPVIFSTYFLTRHRCFHRSFLRRSADPPGSPPSILPTAPLFFRQLCSVPRPAILTVALVPLYLQLPSPRPLSGRYAASESLPFERSFRLLYCFANDLPLPVDSYCIQCLMYEKLSCFR